MKTNITVIGLTEPEEVYDNFSIITMERRIITTDNPMGHKIYYARLEPMYTTATSMFNGTNSFTLPQITSHELKVIMYYED